MDHNLYRSVTTGTPEIGELMKSDEYRQKAVNQVSEGDNTILHLASESGDISLVQYIIQNFEDLLVKTNSRQETALHLAARKGDGEATRELIEAAQKLNLSLEDFIVKCNVDLDTALHLAVSSGDSYTVHVIVQESRSYIYGQNRNMVSPLYAAVEANNLSNFNIIWVLSRKPLCRGGPEGRTSIHTAICKRNRAIVDRLIGEYQEDIWLKDNKGWTAIHYVAFFDWVELLHHILPATNISSMLAPRLWMAIRDGILIASMEGHVSVAKTLLQEIPQENVNGPPTPYTTESIKDKHERNMLHLAVEHNRPEMVQFAMDWIEKYARDSCSYLNARDKDGNTALHVSVMRGHYFPNLINHVQVNKTVLNNFKYTPYDLLYVDDKIIGAQLQIKEAFDALQSSQRGIFYYFRPKDKLLELHNTEGLISPSKLLKRNQEFKAKKTENMKEKVKSYQKQTNTQIIIAALITTVTFTVGFTMPGGYNQSGQDEEGFPVLSRKKAFAVFMAADAIALLFSTAALFLYFVSTLYEDARKISALIRNSTLLNIVSIVAMMVTFMMGTYVVLAQSTLLTIFIFFISSIFFVLVAIQLLRYRRDLKNDRI